MERDKDNWKEQVAFYYKSQYSQYGNAAQRRYPNEELCRFIGSRFGTMDRHKRIEVKTLEVGCGSGGNLWMLAAEGFNVTGIDLRHEALVLAKENLVERNLAETHLVVGDILEMPLRNELFDIIIDVFTTHHIPYDNHLEAYNIFHNLLRPGGYFFSFHPSTESDAYQCADEAKVDPFTLTEIRRSESPFRGNPCFCFLDVGKAKSLLIKAGFLNVHYERCGRTYNCGKEYFENLTLVASK